MVRWRTSSSAISSNTLADDGYFSRNPSAKPRYMRLSSSSLVMASARISCSERSAKRFTAAPHAKEGFYIKNLLNSNSRPLTSRTPMPSLDSGEWQHRHETGQSRCDPPRARTRAAARAALLLALRARHDARRACAGDRRGRAHLSGQAQLCQRLASARRRSGGGRDASGGGRARAARGRQHRTDRAAAPARNFFQQPGFATRPCCAVRGARLPPGGGARARPRDRRARLLRPRRAARRDHGFDPRAHYRSARRRRGQRALVRRGLEEHSDWILALIAKQPDLTLEEILAVMAKQGIPGSRSALQRFFDRHNVSFKKKPARGRAKTSRCRSRPPTLETRARHA